MKNWTLFLLGIASCLVLVVAAPAKNTITQDIAKGQLKHYGYMGKKNPVKKVADMEDKNPTKAYKVGLKMYQARNGLGVTGTLDDATQQLMGTPRCDNPDLVQKGDVYRLEASVPELQEVVGGNLRKRRYEVISNSAWTAGQTLTYNFRNFTSSISESTQRAEAAACMAMWAAAGNIKFEYQESGIAQLDTFFVAGTHNDGSSFDGPGQTLAHAYPPYTNTAFDGDIHMDAAEPWTSGTSSGFNFLQVFCHEAGHSLGLLHSEVSGALMEPFYTSYQPNFQLHPDDIAGVRALYGMAVGPPPPAPDFCTDLGIDAFTTHTESGVLRNYAFKGLHYVQLDSTTGIVDGFPKLIRGDWQGITSTVDAALHLPAYNGQPAFTLLFTGSRYYVYGAGRNLVSEVQGRTLASLRLSNRLTDIDAAFVIVSGRNLKIWITKDGAYYELSRPRRYSLGKLLVGSKKSKSLPANFPSSLDAASNVDASGGNVVNLFSDNTVYQYNSADGSVTNSGSITNDLFGCS